MYGACVRAPIIKCSFLPQWWRRDKHYVGLGADSRSPPPAALAMSSIKDALPILHPMWMVCIS